MESRSRGPIENLRRPPLTLGLGVPRHSRLTLSRCGGPPARTRGGPARQLAPGCISADHLRRTRRSARAKTQARDRLQETADKAREKSQQAAQQLRTESAAAASKADAWGDNIQQSWNEHLANVRERVDARKARHDANKAELNAEDAEDYAVFAIDLAYSAIEEAEYAVLDATLARLDADAAAQTTAG